jgi:outer membrane protein TolC
MRCTPPLLLVLALLPLPASAQPSTQSIALTVEDAVARAVETSARLREVEARVEAAGAVIDQRRAQAQPLVAAQAGYTRTNHVAEFAVPTPGSSQPRVLYPDIPDNYRSRLDVQWPLYTAGRQAALERAARSETAAVSAEQAGVGADVRLDAIRAYWTLVTAGEQLRVVEESIARVQAHLGEARRQLDAGVVAPHEVLAVEAQESRQELLAVQARGNREVAEADLARLIGQPRARIDPISPLTAAAAPASTLESLVAQAASQRPEREAILRRIAAAEARHAAADASSRPTMSAAGGFDYARPNPRIFPREGSWRTSWDASVNLSWPLFDGGRHRAETAEAAAATRAVRARLDEFDAVLEVELRQRLTELATSVASIGSADRAVRAAAEARRVAGERFAAGVATSADVLDAQVALLQSELDRTQAIAAGRIAEARLQRAIGK